MERKTTFIKRNLLSYMNRQPHNKANFRKSQVFLNYF
nr:MAG TPA: hypothetical protein [Caudoviricetes sp.]